MGDIAVLSEDLINKIAAGEVIERPASAVKELLENSLDAKSTHIKISLEKAGMQKIVVEDNGIGMDHQDARLCILRHATSKLKEEQDLFNIQTLGFRGEALSSIASVSQMILRTKRKENTEGIQLYIEKGEITKEQIVGCPTGTLIEIENLFYNVPARKKFLKSEQTELHQILDLVNRYAMIHTHCAFTVVHNGKTLLQTAGDSSMHNALVMVLGAQSAKEMLSVDYSEGMLRIKGFVGKPALNKADRDDQTIFVNGRLIRNKIVNSAIDEAYRTLMMVGRHPAVVLHITIDPAKVDANVHPTKIQIRIQQELDLATSVREAISQTLKAHSLISDGELPTHRSPNFTSYSGMASKRDYPLVRDSQQLLEPALPIASYRGSPHVTKTGYGKRMLTIPDQQSSSAEPALALPNFQVLGQVHKTFILAEVDEGLYIIDQHVAHERVLFEEFNKKMKIGPLQSQQLLAPLHIDLSQKEKILLSEHLDIFLQLGFDIEQMRDDFYVRKVPILLDKEQSIGIIKEMLNGIVNAVDPHENTPIKDLKESMTARMSCRSAVKAGDELTLPQIHRILGQLLNMENPYSCPHGRPIIIRMGVNDLEKMFKRKM